MQRPDPMIAAKPGASDVEAMTNRRSGEELYFYDGRDKRDHKDARSIYRSCSEVSAIYRLMAKSLSGQNFVPASPKTRQGNGSHSKPYMDEYVAKENAGSLPNVQTSHCEWCRRFSSCAGISCNRRWLYLNPEATLVLVLTLVLVAALSKAISVMALTTALTCRLVLLCSCLMAAKSLKSAAKLVSALVAWRSVLHHW